MSLFKTIASSFHLSETKEVIMENLFWAVLGKMVSLFSGLVVGIIVARYLGPSQYGLMNYVISYVFLFQTLAIFGLDSIEVREEARSKMPFTTIIGTAFALKTALAVVFMMAVIATSFCMEADSYTTLLISIYSLTIILNSFSVIRNYFTAIVQNKYVVQAEIARTLIGIGIKLLLLLLKLSLTWFIIAYTFDILLIASGYVVAYRSHVGRLSEWHLDVSYAKYLLKESLPLMLTNVAVIIYQRIDQVMIGQLIDTASVGYYAVASRLVEVLIFIPIILAQTITPVLVSTRERNEADYIHKGQQFMDISFWCSFLAALLTALLSNWVVRLTFGSAYLPAVPILQLLSFKVASVALSNTAGAMLVTEGLQRWAIFRDGLGCLVCITLNYLLLPRYGVIASAFVAIASNVAAGYLADAIIPAYRHLFVRQTKAMLFGWRELLHFKELFKS